MVKLAKPDSTKSTTLLQYPVYGAAEAVTLWGWKAKVGAGNSFPAYTLCGSRGILKAGEGVGGQKGGGKDKAKHRVPRGRVGR